MGYPCMYLYYVVVLITDIDLSPLRTSDCPSLDELFNIECYVCGTTEAEHAGCFIIIRRIDLHREREFGNIAEPQLVN